MIENKRVYQMAAVGAGKVGPGISYTDLYSLKAAVLTKTEASEPMSCP